MEHKFDAFVDEDLLDQLAVRVVVMVMELFKVWKSVCNDFCTVKARQCCAKNLGNVFSWPLISRDCIDFGVNDRALPEV